MELFPRIRTKKLWFRFTFIDETQAENSDCHPWKLRKSSKNNIYVEINAYIPCGHVKAHSKGFCRKQGLDQTLSKKNLNGFLNQ